MNLKYYQISSNFNKHLFEVVVDHRLLELCVIVIASDLSCIYFRVFLKEINGGKFSLVNKDSGLDEVTV